MQQVPVDYMYVDRIYHIDPGIKQTTHTAMSTSYLNYT